MAPKDPSKDKLNQLASAWVASGFSPAAWLAVLGSPQLLAVANGYARAFRGDQGSDLVQELLASWTVKPPTFRGSGQFSAYLRRVLTNRFVDSTKTYIPSAVSKRGQRATEAWRLLSAGVNSASVVDFLTNHMTPAEALALIETLRRVHLADKTGTRRIEQIPFTTLDWDEDRQSDPQLDPLEAFAHAEQIKLVIERLGPEWREIVREYFLERGENLVAIGQKHGVKSVKHDWENKIAPKLRKALE